MAIIKSIYSTKLKGSVGDVVYYNTSAGNVVRTKAASVENPRTLAQQKQRAKFATVGHAYSLLKDVCNHSREGVTSGQPTQSAFLKDNAARVEYVSARGNGSVTNNFVVSRGSLTPEGWDQEPMLTYNSDTTSASTLFYGFYKMNIQQVAQMLGITDYAFFDGLQVTFLSVYRKDSATGYDTSGGTQAVYTRIGKQYFVLSGLTNDLVTELGPSSIFPLSPFNWSIDEDKYSKSDFISESSFIQPNLYASDVLTTSSRAAGWWLAGSQTTDINATEFAGALILSKKDGDTWKYSTSTLYRVPSSDQTQSEPGESAEAWDITAAAETYDPQSAYYLNQTENVTNTVNINDESSIE